MTLWLKHPTHAHWGNPVTVNTEQGNLNLPDFLMVERSLGKQFVTFFPPSAPRSWSEALVGLEFAM